MPNRCAANGCINNASKNSTCTLHRFPLGNADLLKLWMHRLSRENFVPTQHSRLCSRHFKDSDFRTDISDKNFRRMKRRVGDRVTRLRRKLKSGAVPSIFTESPPCSSTALPGRRMTERATASARRERLNANFDRMEADLKMSDSVRSIGEVCQKLLAESYPSGFILHPKDGLLYLLYLNLSSTPPRIDGSIVLHPNMRYEIYARDKSIAKRCFQHITTSDHVSQISILLNLMAFVKNYSSDMELHLFFIDDRISILVGFKLRWYSNIHACVPGILFHTAIIRAINY